MRRNLDEGRIEKKMGELQWRGRWEPREAAVGSSSFWGKGEEVERLKEAGGETVAVRSSSAVRARQTRRREPLSSPFGPSPGSSSVIM